MSREIDPPVVEGFPKSSRTGVSHYALRAWNDWAEAELRLEEVKQRFRTVHAELAAAQEDRDSAKLAASEALRRSAREQAGTED